MSHFRKFFANWRNWPGVVLVLFFVITAIAAPVLSPQDPKLPGAFKQVGRASDNIPHPPSATSILGTLPQQYDVFHTLVWGTRDALLFGLMVALGSFLIGVLYGAVAGNTGGFVNGLMIRIADAFLTFPPIAGVVFVQQLIAITITALGGIYMFYSQSHTQYIYFFGKSTPLMVFFSKVNPLLVILILFSWMPYARLVNTIILTLRKIDYVEAARALGASPSWVIWRHLIPNSIGPSLVLAARDVGSALIIQSTFTFIGIGGNSPWGELLSLGRNWVIGAHGIFDTWWSYLPATLAIIFFGVAWNMIGDGIADSFSPTRVAPVPGIFSRFKRVKPDAEAVAATPSLARPFGVQMDPAILSRLPRTAGAPAVRSTAPAVSQVGNAGVAPLLLTARDAIRNRNLDQALHAYAHLIEKGQSLDLVIQDLAAIAQRVQNNALVWKTLGDALTHAGKNEYAEMAYKRFKLLNQ